jgi:AraC-like DNA-binding protein
LDSDNIPLRIWQLIAGALLVSGPGEIGISLAHATGHGAWQPLILSGLSSLTLVGLGILGLSPHLYPPSPAPEATKDTIVTPTEQSVELMVRLQALLQKEPLFLDPDLTLSRLARRMLVPVKALSSAINQSSGDNVSRFINSYRIEHACDLLDQARSITSTMFDSGFQTKSNFNREFLRLKGCAPKTWLAQRIGQAGCVGKVRGSKDPIYSAGISVSAPA